MIYAYTRLRYQVSVYRTIGPLVYHFDTNSRFPPILLYVRCKLGVTFVLRCTCDVKGSPRHVHIVCRHRISAFCRLAVV